MFRFIAAILAFFSISGFAHHDPITEFPEGTYLGEGKFVRTTGEEGHYSSYASFYSDEWYFALVFEDRLSVYELYFTFQFEGFFAVEAVEHTPDGDEYTHYGYGHCGSVQCHYVFDLENRTIEETVTFATWHNKIFRLGSMRYLDENGDLQTISWEERMMLMQDPGHDDDDDDDDDDDTVITIPMPPHWPHPPGLPIPVVPIPAPVPPIPVS